MVFGFSIYPFTRLLIYFLCLLGAIIPDMARRIVACRRVSEGIAAAFQIAAAPAVQLIADLLRRHDVIADRAAHLAGDVGPGWRSGTGRGFRSGRLAGRGGLGWNRLVHDGFTPGPLFDGTCLSSCFAGPPGSYRFVAVREQAPLLSAVAGHRAEPPEEVLWADDVHPAG